MSQASTQELATFLDIATEAVHSGGAVLEDYWGNLKSIEEKGRSGDLVTEADKAAEVEVLRVLRDRVSDHPVLTEESGEINTRESKYLWAVDPLDGTTNYAHQYPMSCVSVGLLIDGIPQVGAVYNPFRQELFRAARGLGATCNYRTIKISDVSQLPQSLLVTGFAYDRTETVDNNYAEFCHLTHLTQGVRRSGSAALDLCDVACGRLDGYWERGIKLWDMAAGIVLVQEAGGKVTAYDGGPLQIASGRLLATNGLLHTQLSQALQEAPPLSDWKNHRS